MIQTLNRTDSPSLKPASLSSGRRSKYGLVMHLCPATFRAYCRADSNATHRHKLCAVLVGGLMWLRRAVGA
jgi:hypothetical protein